MALDKLLHPSKFQYPHAKKQPLLYTTVIRSFNKQEIFESYIDIQKAIISLIFYSDLKSRG